MHKPGTLLEIGRTFGLRDGMLRLGYELQRGTGVFSLRIRSAQGWDHWAFDRIAPHVSAENFLDARRNGSHPFFFGDPRILAPKLREILRPAGEQSLLAEANNILAGTLPYFGRLHFSCGFPPNWFQNPATGQRVSPGRSWTTMRFAGHDYGDLKFILEPSRFLFVYPLARAYAISGDERFPEAFWSAIEDWADHNPPMSGPLWICGQESSLRILALSFALYAFLRSRSTTPQRAAQLLSLIAAHAWRTDQTIGYARSQRSNHLFSEAVGLWTAGTLYPELKLASRWQQRGAQLLSEALRDQITPQGAFLQHSFNYQRMILHQLFWILRLAHIHRVQLDPEIRARTESCLDFVRNFVDPVSGQAPNFGSNDGSHILPLSSCDYADYRPLLQLGAGVLGHPSTLKPGPWDETALWFGGDSQKRIEQAWPHPVASATGYHRVGTETSWAMVRAASYTRRPFQADQLHVDLWWHGLNLARDPGTYLYNGEPPWNNALAGTAVHNTVMVDGRDQMRRASRFLWLDWAQASGRSFARSSEDPNHNSRTSASLPDAFVGEHDGYRRIGVTHRRTVRCVTEDAWVVVDDLLGAGDHELRLHWLVPDLPFEIASHQPFCLEFRGPSTRLRWSIYCDLPAIATIFRAGKKVAEVRTDPGKTEPNRSAQNQLVDPVAEDAQLLGWESHTYGELQPAISIVYRVQAPLPARLITAILADESVQLQGRSGHLHLSRGDTEIYQVSSAPTIDLDT